MSIRVYLPLLTALALYTLLASHHLALPGLHHDEAQEAGLMAMQLEAGTPPTLFRGAHWVLAGRAWPIMVQDYIGALNVYLTWAAFGLGGVSVESLRWVGILTGLFTLLLAYGAVGELFGRRAAALSVLTLALHPTFIFWTRQGVYVTSYTLALALGALYLGCRWWRGAGALNLYGAAFLLGLGLWGKLLFLWFIGGLIVGAAALMLWPPRPKLPPPAKFLPPLLIALACFLAGLYPLLDYNRQTGGTWQSIANNADQSYYGVNNADVGQNLQTRLAQTPTVFSSGHLRELGGLYPNPWGRGALYVSLGGMLLAIFWHKKRARAHFFWLLVVAAMIAQSSFTATALWFTHFALVLPFLALLPPLSLEPWLKDGWARLLLGGLLAAFLALQLLSTASYHRALSQTGGLNTHSAAIYTLADTLDQSPPRRPIAALDWGIGPAVEMLTEGRQVPNEVFGYSWATDEGFEARLAPFLALDESLYVLHVEGETVFPRREAFFQAVAAAGREAFLVAIIPDKQGQGFYEIWATRGP